LEQSIISAAQNAWGSRNRSFCKELRATLLKSGITAKEVDKIISKAKIKAANGFARVLDKKIFGSPILGIDKSKHEILRIAYKLFVY